MNIITISHLGWTSSWQCIQWTVELKNCEMIYVSVLYFYQESYPLLFFFR